MSEQAQASTKKAPTVYHTVTLTDGRVVDFPGNRQIQKDILVDEDAGTVAVRFDFRNGETRTYTVPTALLLQAAGHGLSQKIGDAAASEKDVDDALLAIEKVGDRIAGGEWNAAGRQSGDSFSGASVVIKALVMESGKTVAEVKAFLEGKLEAGAASGLTRSKLYASFKNPATKIGQRIAQLQAEKDVKAAGVSGDDLFNELAQ